MAAKSATLLPVIRTSALEIHARCEVIFAKPGSIASSDVHALRVASKRLRACWQVLKPLLASTDAEDAERALKKAAASLSDARDLQVMSTTLATLARHARSKDAGDILATGHQVLFAAHPPRKLRGKRSDALVNAFRQDQIRWSELELSLPDKRLLRCGIARLYEKARKRARTAQETGDVTHWHRNRKWVKYLSYALGWLEHMPLPMDQQDMAGLAQMLGELHDIHCVIEYAQAQAAAFADADQCAYLIHQLRTEESHLQWRCEKSARKLLKPSARAFSDALVTAYA